MLLKALLDKGFSQLYFENYCWIKRYKLVPSQNKKKSIKTSFFNKIYGRK
jgi:hypothetical protein